MLHNCAGCRCRLCCCIIAAVVPHAFYASLAEPHYRPHKFCMPLGARPPLTDWHSLRHLPIEIALRASLKTVVIAAATATAACRIRECYARGLAVVVVGFPATSLLMSRTRICISAGHT